MELPVPVDVFLTRTDLGLLLSASLSSPRTLQGSCSGKVYCGAQTSEYIKEEVVLPCWTRSSKSLPLGLPQFHWHELEGTAWKLTDKPTSLVLSSA